MYQSKSQAPAAQWATQLSAGIAALGRAADRGSWHGVALAARATWSFDGLYGQDAFAYFPLRPRALALAAAR